MYLGIDIGGTKTLVALLSVEGQIVKSQRFPTNPDYDQFLKDLAQTVDELEDIEVHGAAMGIPGLINREEGLVYALGKLPWQNKSIRSDVSRILNDIPVVIENDARLAGLSEAQLLKGKYKTVLFMTVSTGIGIALVEEGQIVKALQDTEAGHMPLYYEGKLIEWEDFAGGKAIVNQLGKRAVDITDDKDWQIIAKNIGLGLAPLCAVLQPEAVVLGGSVGAFAAKFSNHLADFLIQNLPPVVKQPQAILAAQRADDAVIHGCYELVKQI